MSEKIKVENLHLYYGEKEALKGIDLSVKENMIMSFIGPSGCGKSTTLRLIAGLEDITDGELWIDGELGNYLEPKEREMSMVFQNYALYPNMTVYGNIAYSLKIRKVPKEEIDKRVKEMIELQNAIDIDNEKNVLILNKEDFRKYILDKDVYEKIEHIWINQNIILNAEEVRLLEAKAYKHIPKEFFGQELRGAAE